MIKLLLFFAIQMNQMNTLQSKKVVHLAPHHAEISVDSGGKLVQLINAPPTVFLPSRPPLTDSEGSPWEVDVANLGPSAVTIMDAAVPSLKVTLQVKQTLHFHWSGTSYSWKM